MKSRDARNAVDAAARRSPGAGGADRCCGLPAETRRPRPHGARQEMAKIEAEPVTLEMAGEDELKKLRGIGTGKLLLVNFWATWCGPCVTEFPELETTYRDVRSARFGFRVRVVQ